VRGLQDKQGHAEEEAVRPRMDVPSVHIRREPLGPSLLLDVRDTEGHADERRTGIYVSTHLTVLRESTCHNKPNS
jgi:hypothetical protein